MQYDFDQMIDRRESDSLKWRRARQSDLIPMWVADMDFASPECVRRAMHTRVDHGVFGYAAVPEEVNRAVVAWAESHYGWDIDPRWIVWMPGLVPALHVACTAFAEADEEVLTFVPIYPPFLWAPPARGRAVKKVPLTQQDGRWMIDFDRLEEAVTERTRLLFFCHPHNPVGRTFTREELAAVGEFCKRHDLLVCSDEIHCDLTLIDRRHIPLASLDDETRDRCITLMSPGKTFNTTGLNCGFAVISDDRLRKRFENAAAGMVPHPNGLGYAACRAAFEEGEPWRKELVDYLRGNRDLLESFFREHLPMFPISHVEATYLAWFDTRWLGERNSARFFEDAGVQLSDGALFAGKGSMRLNFGCPRETLQDALDRILRAVEKVL